MTIHEREKAEEYLADGMVEGVSGCCGAKVYNPGNDECGVCMDCKDHCSIETYAPTL